MQYMPKAFVLGAACSVACVSIFILLCIIDGIIKISKARKAKKSEQTLPIAEEIPLIPDCEVMEASTENEEVQAEIEEVQTEEAEEPKSEEIPEEKVEEKTEKKEVKKEKSNSNTGKKKKKKRKH